MKMFSLKFKWAKTAKLLLNLAFIALVIYEGLFIYNLYKSLNVEPTYTATKRVVRVDFKVMDQAIARYQAAQSFNIVVPVDQDGKPIPSVVDPFSNNVPIPSNR